MARIASVHFNRKETTRAYRAQPYILEAVELGAAPFILDVPLERQTERGGFSQSSNKRVRSMHKYIIEEYSIAHCLVAEFAHRGLGMTEGQRPGIWVVRDKIPLIGENGVQTMDADDKGITRDATKEEFAAMFAEDLAAYRKADVEYARWCVGQGNAIAQDVRRIQFIPDLYRSAADHLKMTVEWTKPSAGMLEMKLCPYCSSVVPKASSVCHKCQNIIDPVVFAAKETEIKQAAPEAKRRTG